jgi:hypothetical protein
MDQDFGFGSADPFECEPNPFLDQQHLYNILPEPLKNFIFHQYDL